jgi:glycosyltransferase involved in cell wall biosynthesis
MKKRSNKRHLLNRSPFIYIACPWGPFGGGMYKVADYLIQSQSLPTPPGYAALRPLDTRGGGPAIGSLLILAVALFRVLSARLSGKLAGVHINMAERLSLLRKCLLILWCRLCRIPVVLHLHAAQLPQFYISLPRSLQGLLRWSFQQVDACVVLGKAAQDYVENELQVPSQKVYALNNGVPSPPMSHRIEQTADKRILFFLGNLMERKGVSDLLKALTRSQQAQERQIKTVIAGGGDMAHYRQLADELGLGKQVELIGWLDQKQASEWMAQADALILPSYDEGLPLVILEALSHGVAVICTPVGEIPGVLHDRIDAHFIQPGAIDEIAAAIDEVMSDDHYRKGLGEKGRVLFDQEFSMEQFFDRLGDIHQHIFGVRAQMPLTTRISRKESQ